MNEHFFSLIEQLPMKLNRLLDVSPIKPPSVALRRGLEGVYLFSELESHLYVGRARCLRRRLHNHHRGTHTSATFAVKLAREETGVLATYKKEEKASFLISNSSEFGAAFERARMRIRNMDVRWIEERDPLMQSLLEIYVSITLKTKYNDWRTT